MFFSILDFIHLKADHCFGDELTWIKTVTCLGRSFVVQLTFLPEVTNLTFSPPKPKHSPIKTQFLFNYHENYKFIQFFFFLCFDSIFLTNIFYRARWFFFSLSFVSFFIWSFSVFLSLSLVKEEKLSSTTKTGEKMEKRCHAKGSNRTETVWISYHSKWNSGSNAEDYR